MHLSRKSKLQVKPKLQKSKLQMKPRKKVSPRVKSCGKDQQICDKSKSKCDPEGEAKAEEIKMTKGKVKLG